MRAYDVTATALALGVERKWIDNVLAHHSVAGVESLRQGVRRRLSPRAVLTLALTLVLIRDLGLPLPRALALADRILDGRGSIRTEAGLALSLDVSRFERGLAERLAEAAEAAPPRRRGRPPRAIPSRPARP